MNCNDFQDQLSAFLDGELKTPMVDEMQRHLAACQDCANVVAAQKRLSKMVGLAGSQRNSGLTWEMVARRLDDNQSSAPVTVAQPNAQSRRRMWVRSALALAAAVLLIVGLRFESQRNSENTRNVAATINLEPVVESFVSGADKAMESLAKLYPDASVHHHLADADVVSPTSSMPVGVSLVSTKVVHLPFCNCPPGKCQCGPGDCECIAGVCERVDGSRFLLVEHCNTYDVTFGKNAAEFVQQGGQGFQSVRLHDVLAVSWERDDRRLTAIGLRDSDEANQLVATSISLTL